MEEQDILHKRSPASLRDQRGKDKACLGTPGPVLQGKRRALRDEKRSESQCCRRAPQAKGTAQGQALRWQAERTAGGPGEEAGSGAVGSGAGDKAAKAGEALIIYLEIMTIT